MTAALCLLLVCLPALGDPFMIDDPALAGTRQRGVQPVPYVASLSGGNLRNDLTGYVGMKFTPNTNRVVTALGRYVISGNKQNHRLLIIKTSDCSVLASVDLITTGAETNTVAYTNLASPITIAKGVEYGVVSSETAGKDRWYDNRKITHATFTGTASKFGANAPGSGCFSGGGTDKVYGTTDFKSTEP